MKGNVEAETKAERQFKQAIQVAKGQEAKTLEMERAYVRTQAR